MIKTIGHKLACTTALAAALAFSGAAHAEDAYSGHWQFKVLATAVLPSGSLASVADHTGILATAPGDPLYGLTTTASSSGQKELCRASKPKALLNTPRLMFRK